MRKLRGGAFVRFTNRRTGPDAHVPFAPMPTRLEARVSPVRAIVERIAARREEIAREMVDCYARDIVDSRVAAPDFLHGEVYGVSLETLDVLMSALVDDEAPAEQWLERTRRGAARRVHEGISLESFLHATRLWGQVTWETVLEAARPDDPDEREAALKIAGAVMRHVDTMSAVWAGAYLAEAEGISSDRAVLRRDL